MILLTSLSCVESTKTEQEPLFREALHSISNKLNFLLKKIVKPLLWERAGIKHQSAPQGQEHLDQTMKDIKGPGHQVEEELGQYRAILLQVSKVSNTEIGWGFFLE